MFDAAAEREFSPTRSNADKEVRARVVNAPYAPDQRRSYLFIFVFVAWAGALCWFGPRLVELVLSAQTPLTTFALSYFAIFTTLAWLYGLYNFGVVSFSIIYRRIAKSWAPPVTTATPPVAILYTTCNDFVEESAESCLGVEYPQFHLYILDDSSSAVHKRRVDRFAARHADRVSVVRRANRTGFKAGNLNHALKHRVIEPYFAIVDADEIVPRDFLCKLVPYLEYDPACGFVQAIH